MCPFPLRAELDALNHIRALVDAEHHRLAALRQDALQRQERAELVAKTEGHLHRLIGLYALLQLADPPRSQELRQQFYLCYDDAVQCICSRSDARPGR